MERMLLHSFIERTSPLLFCLAEQYTALFVHHLLDWGFADSLIMNGILAVASADSMVNGLNSQCEARRLQCYGATITGLNHYLTEWDGSDPEEALRLLTTTYLLILHEVSGVTCSSWRQD